MVEVIPAIIPQDLNILREKFKRILGLVRKVQMDVVDGNYASTKTWPFNGNQFEELRNMVRGDERFPNIDNFILEIDMLILHPIEYVSDFISVGAKSFVIHLDSTDHVKECIEVVKYAKCQVGLGIKPSGDISVLESFLPDLDFVQFMGNDRVGYSGVELDMNVLGKIKNFHERHPSAQIQIDIGVDFNTAPKLIEAGVTAFVSGSSIFNSPNAKEAIKTLQNN